jgi:Mg-chelatase subunit ChlD
MENRFLSFGRDGKPVVKSFDGKEYPLPLNPSVPREGRPVVLLAIDCSSSMEGEKISQAKQGALDFAETALRKGYSMGLIKFDNEASLICEPTINISSISSAIEKLTAGGITNLTDALKIAFAKLKGKGGCTVIATDGYPTERSSALDTADRMKKNRIEILAISTEDADQDFISRLVSRKDLNLKVRDTELKTGFRQIAEKLPYKAIGYRGG